MSHHLGALPVESGGRCAESRTGSGAASGFAARLRRLLRCGRGNAAVEFGLSAPVLLVVLVPLADLGIAFSTQHQLEEAVQAGAQYAASHPWNRNSPADIGSAVTGATSLSGISLSPAPHQICGCPSGAGGNGVVNGSSGIATANCGGTCSTGETAGYYVIVSAQLPYTPIVPYSLFGSSTTLAAEAMIRIR